MTTEALPLGKVPVRVLVVDDSVVARRVVARAIEADPRFELAGVAANGSLALEKLDVVHPDVLVLDLDMPVMNGFDVAAVLRNDPKTADIPIVILSIVQDRERGFRLGVDRYLSKPIDTDLLFREVETLLQQRKSHKHVLVVDEDASTVTTLGDVLTARGYHVSKVRRDDLFETAKSLRPDVILLNSDGPSPESVQMLRFEKGLENVLFLVYR